MKRALPLLLIATLAACAPKGPSQAQAEAALRQYFATPHAGSVDVSGGELRGATLASFSDCSAMGSTYRCFAEFSRDGALLPASVVIVARDGGWSVTSVQPREPATVTYYPRGQKGK